MSASDLLYTEVEDDLRGTVRKLLRDRCEWTAVLASCERGEPYDLDLWRSLAADLGLVGLHIPEEFGGSGASVRELAVLAEETGRAVAPIPLLGSILAATALLECSAEPGAAELLPSIADGSAVATCALPMTTAPGSDFPRSVRAEGSTLTGTVRAVVDLEVADVIVVPASDADGPALYLLDASAQGVTRSSDTPLDLTRRFGELDLEGASANRLATGDTATRAFQVAVLTAAGVLASEQVGLAQLCLDSTVEYGLTRHQFGRAIGSFQAVKHRLADLWAAVSTARATARNAADRLARPGDETPLAVAVAQAYCSDVVVLAAEECLQLHGGIGMTWEHPAHLYLGRAKSSQLTFGVPDRHRARIAELAGIPFP